MYRFDWLIIFAVVCLFVGITVAHVPESCLTDSECAMLCKSADCDGGPSD